MHILAADGRFANDGFFYAPAINIDRASIEKLFIHKIFKLLLSKSLITERIVKLISSWRHSGFGAKVKEAIAKLESINPRDINTDKIKLIAERDDTVINRSFKNDQIEAFSKDILASYTAILNLSTCKEVKVI